MLKNLLLTIGIVLTTSMLVFSQSGALQGKVLDKETGEPIPFANIILEQDGNQVAGTTSDFEGNYTIKPLEPAKYDLKATYVGYKPIMISGIVIKSDQIRFYNIEMESTAVELETYEVVDYKVPLIDKDQTSGGATVTSEEIDKMPNKSANAVAVTVGGVFSRDGERGSIRGAREEGTVMYIDGVKVTGTSSLPESAIEQVQVVLSGLPAQYGDATGGVINVTTKGPSRSFAGGVEAQTSQYLDAYGYNRVGVNFQGPLIRNKRNDKALLGFFIAGEGIYREDGNPFSIGVHKVKDDVLAGIEEQPYRLSGTGAGLYQNAEFLRMSDFEHLDATLNNEDLNMNISGKLDVRTTPNTNLTFGGNMSYSDNSNFNYYHSLFNYENNSQTLTNTWRVFGKFTHRFPTDSESEALIKNVYYTIQADYTQYSRTQQDPTHQDDLFKYGYVGKFDTYYERSYELGEDTIFGGADPIYYHNGFNDTLIDFTHAEVNPILSNYTQAFYDLYPDPEGHYRKKDDIISGKGLLNGMTPDPVYGLWGAPGSIQSGYSIRDNEQIGINAHGAADIGNHEIKFGLQYEQRTNRGYNYAPQAFWSVMRGLTNAHIEQLDFGSAEYVRLNGVFQDTVNYDRLYDAPSQRQFDKSLRQMMGLPVDGTDWVDIDSYDPNTYTISYYDNNGKRHTTQLNEPLSVDMFSADEMLNNGDYLTTYWGYDYSGDKLETTPSFEDFFTKTDENGNNLRPIAPFQPIYMAGYVQDKFAFKDLIFNVGLRVDRFDANQMVLKDPYVLYPAVTVGELKNGQFSDSYNPDELGPIPGNMGDDYTVYVDNNKDANRITGYRFEDQWYNSEGIVTTDPETILDAGNGVQPALEKPDDQVVRASAFTDYEPQLTYMPRISFSFPISDEALFFAHYDVLTQRPKRASEVLPTEYFFMATQSSPTINNPNLKPERTVDYELGFQQKLTNSSSLIIQTFYREMRDMIQSYRYTAAYPKTYYSYNNIDFGTVKGLTVTYDLRRTNNARLRASYTLQFAKGTGSDINTSSALIRSGQPNLRTLIPLDFDRRHNINILFDFRYGEGKKYTGPTISKVTEDGSKNVQLLKNTGVNFVVTGGSGVPYTQSSTIYPITSPNPIIKGSLNGSRLPWQFRVDARLDRDINLSWGKAGDDNKGGATLNIYLQVLNVFNTQNVMNVYRATGEPDDDGYLAADQYQSQIEQQLNTPSYLDMYRLRINSPYNYSSPRRIRLGLILNF
ncbi:MAG: carboxypeptidase-like regulatory domain-containing protein [Bacteroidales bacterium]|nr:carboxypeptidase-like regulatory domain-containing protein [Bacteroidales bacterium]